MKTPRIVIIGAGPTGLGAALRLSRAGYTNWTLYEDSNRPGGLAGSEYDNYGFTWDHGGHVLFSHYKYFDQTMAEAAVAADFTWLTHKREAYAMLFSHWNRYPLQQNIWRLPSWYQTTVLNTIEQEQRAPRKVENFEDWLLASFGTALCEHFMFPYNFKVWGCPPSMMSASWVGERVATINLEELRQRTRLGVDAEPWGPNATFQFPSRGGTGHIWRGVARLIKPRHNLVYNTRVIGVNLERRLLDLEDRNTGHISSVRYDALISTMPLDKLLRLSYEKQLQGMAPYLKRTKTHIFGFGIKGEPPPHMASKSWLYFPQIDNPVYRATIFSNYSPNNAPEGHWSVMCEVAESSYKPYTADTPMRALSGMIRTGVIPENADIVSHYYKILPYGYPVPWKDRDMVLGVVQPILESKGVFSRGRFGAWKYEVSNQDHSFMQGVEIVDRVLFDHPENTFNGTMGVEPPPLDSFTR